MDRPGETLVRDLQLLRDENERLRTVERELSAVIESLRASEDRLRLAVEVAHAGIWEWDVTSDRVTWDATKHAVFGLAEGSFAGTRESFFELVHPDDRATLRTALGAALEHNLPYRNEFRIVRANGDTRWIANLAQVFRADDGRPLRMLGVIQDVTDRRGIEKTLRESEERFRSFANTTSEWIWEVDVQGRFQYSNPAVEQILGYRPDELLGHSVADFVHEDDRATAQQTFANAVAQQRGWTGLSIRCRHRNQTYRHLLCHGVPLVDEDGRLIGFRGSDRDVTDRLEAEQQRMNAHRMEGIGELTGGFAHHFNNLLTVILASVDLAAKGTAAGSPPDVDLQSVLQAAHRGALLTKQLLTFAGKEPAHPRVLNLNVQIAQMRNALRPLLGATIELTLHLDPHLWDVSIDPSHFETAIVNLIVNAQESMPHGGVLKIVTANVGPSDPDAPRGPEVVRGDYVRVSIADTGSGMTAEVAEKVFEPFFSTKARGAAVVGLGLSTCYGIVAQHGGQIRIQTHVGTGSTIHLFLRRSAVPVFTDSSETGPGSSGPTVLVVDDDLPVCKSVSRLLRAYGYVVLEALGGDEALAVARNWQGTIDVLLTDIAMPGMNGTQLANDFALERPNARVIFMSGHANSLRTAQAQHDASRFISKPFVTGDLIALLREVVQMRPNS